MELQGFIIKASPLIKSFLPRRPLSLLKTVSATTVFCANTVFLVLLIIFINIQVLGTLLRLDEEPSLDWIEKRP